MFIIQLYLSDILSVTVFDNLDNTYNKILE